ncbi:MAG: hypothetical protein Q8N89_05835 [Azonexus sp.]|nr:hypothetical protein [Azonexus sp.]
MKLTGCLALGQVAFLVQFIGQNRGVLTALWVNPGKTMLRKTVLWDFYWKTTGINRNFLVISGKNRSPAIFADRYPTRGIGNEVNLCKSAARCGHPWL